MRRSVRTQVDGMHDRVVARTPAGRWSVSGDLAGIAVFLASSASDSSPMRRFRSMAATC
jgi:2-deoxy-D-gluconate 3-dehydrogenase